MNLKVLGKPSLFAGDDIRIPMMFGMVFRFIEIVLCLPLLVVSSSQGQLSQTIEYVAELCTDEDSDFYNEHKYPRVVQNVQTMTVAYIATSFVIALIGFLEYAALYRLSGLGTPTNTEPRKYMPLICNIDHTLTYYLRILVFALGIVVALTFAEYCNCVDHVVSNSSKLSGAIYDARSACKVYRASYTVCMFALITCQVIDFWYGIAYYANIIFRLVPYGMVLSAERQWDVCCRCVLGCLSCMTCFSLGGIESIGSGELQHFASLLTDYFDTDGIIDIAPSDLLAGLYITRLIHLEEENTTRQRIDEELQMELSTSKRPDDAGADKSSGKDAVVNNDETSGPGLMKSRASEVLNSTGSSLIDRSEVLKTSKRSRASVLMMKSTGKSEVDDATLSSLVTQSFIPVIQEKVSPDNDDDKLIVAEGARFLSFAVAIYEWSIMDKLSATRGKFTKDDDEDDDRHPPVRRNCAMKHYPIFGLKETDIVYANYFDGLSATPFAVVLDHVWKTVVITIRGSVSIDDMITDVSMHTTELTSDGELYGFDGQNKFGHTGILGAAKWVTDHILRYVDFLWSFRNPVMNHHFLINFLFLISNRSKILNKLLLDDSAEYKDYQLRVTGHSLGAGAASFVALFLRSKFPDVKAITYEPPGCTMGWNLAEESTSWCLSFVNGMDVVCRISYDSMSDLRDEILVSIARIKVPKHIILSNRSIDQHGIDAVREFLASALYAEGDIPESKFLESMRQFRQWTRLKKEERAKAGDSGLFMPGKLIHFWREGESAYDDNRAENAWGFTEEESSSQREVPAQACWTSREEYNCIVLSPHFISDHLTESVSKQFSSLTKSFGLKEPYSDVLAK